MVSNSSLRASLPSPQMYVFISGFYCLIYSIYSVQSAPASISRKEFSVIHQGASSHSLWYDIKTLRWVVEPGTLFASYRRTLFQNLMLYTASSIKLLLIPLILFINWELLAPYVAKGHSNPFEPFIFISHHLLTSSPDDPRYAKGYLDLVFIAYYIIFFSFVRQTITISLCWPVARYFGIKKQSKLDRFGEQGYAVIYFAVMGTWGIVSGFSTQALRQSADRN